MNKFEALAKLQFCKSFALLAVTALAFFPAVSCVSRPHVSKPGYGAEIPFGDQVSADAECYGVPEEPDSDRIPQYIRNTVRSAPRNAVLGIGTARRLTLPVSRSAAMIKAREDISRQLEIIARDIAAGCPADSETDSRIALAFSDGSGTVWDVRGSSVIDEVMADDGYYWVVMMLSRNNALRTIELSAARSVPGERMDAALERNNLAFRAQFFAD